jgi:Kef-type K+ transport system membrane component KefB
MPPSLLCCRLIAVSSFSICAAVILGLSAMGVVPFLDPLTTGCRASVAAIAASIMVARSPASAIAVVKELKAKGVMTSTLLGVTVLCDVYVLMGFTLTTTIAESECKGEGFSVASLGIMVGTIIGSVVIGVAIGKFLLVLMWFKRFPARYLILPLGLGIFVLAHWFTDWTLENAPFVINFEPLLICIAGGYVCTNQSKHRHRFIQVLQQAGPYVFLPFFTLTGASLDLTVLVQSFLFAAILALVRALSVFIGSATGGWLAGQAPQHNKYIWMTLLTQAGVSLGLASEVGMSFPEWGRAFQTAIISVVLVNQILGPVLFKIAIRRVGEAGKGGSGDQFDEDAEVPTALVLGSTPDALSLAVRLLHAKWRVILVAANNTEAGKAMDRIRVYAVSMREGHNGTLERTVENVKSALSSTPVSSGHDEHGPKKLIEDSFKAVALLGEDDSPVTNPFLAGHILTQDTGMGAKGAGTDFRFAAVVSLIQNTRTLQAVAGMLPTDALNLAVCSIVDATIAASPKKSHLHSVRILSRVNEPQWASVFEDKGIIPIHPFFSESHLAAKLLMAPHGKPIPVFNAPCANDDDLAKAARGLLESSEHWTFEAAWRRFLVARAR